MLQGNQACAPQLLTWTPRGRALQQEKPPQREAHALQVKSRPLLPTREKAYAQQERPVQPKKSGMELKLVPAPPRNFTHWPGTVCRSRSNS